VLDALHTNVERTYTDMQLKNFLWDREAQQLKIIDWNNVSSPKNYLAQFQEELKTLGVKDFAGLVQRDLIRFAAYLYKLLTTKAAAENGESGSILERRAGPLWNQFAVVNRQLLIKALHSSPARRFQTAAQFLQAVQDAIDLWEWKQDESVYTVDQLHLAVLDFKALTPTQMDPEQIARLDRAWAVLDMADRRQVSYPTKESDRQELMRLVNGDSAQWAVGKRYYDAGQYMEAARHWEAEAKSQRRPELWRWCLVAKTGASPQVSSPVFQEICSFLEKTIQAIAEKQLVLAGDHLQKVFAQLDLHKASIPESVLIIKNEIEIHKTIASATQCVLGEKEQQWTQAVEYYQNAQTLLSKFPYSQALVDEYGWENLAQQIESINQKIKLQTANRQQQQLVIKTLDNNVEKGAIPAIQCCHNWRFLTSVVIITDPSRKMMCAKYWMPVCSGANPASRPKSSYAKSMINC